MGKKKQVAANITAPEQLNKDEITASVSRKKHRRSTIIVIAVLAVMMSVILSIGLAFSWFSPTPEADVSVIVTDFSTETQISLSGSSFKTLEDTDKIVVGASSPNVDTLKLQIKYTGRSSAYIRVQLFESFKNSNDALYPSTDVRYVLGPGWIEKDGYYYYKNIVKPDTSKGESKTITFVTEASTSYNTTTQNDVYFNLVSVVEAVQPDRFEEFFGASPEEIFG